MGKLLAIVNPALGQSWFDVVTRADIDTKTSRLSIEKLLDMVKAKVPNHVRDRWVHWMSAGTAIHSTYGIPKGDKAFKEWVKKEVWLEHLIEKACDVFKETSNEYGLEVVVPHGEDLESWFRAFKLANRTNILKAYHKHMSATLGSSECYEIDKSSRRVCYRYYKHLHNGKHLEKIPNELKSWKTLDENGMYSKKGNLDRLGGLSDYEIQNCPWWIDFIVGEYPLEEEAEYKANSKVMHPKRPRESIEKVSHELGNRSSDGKITKRKKLKQDTLKTSSEVDVFDDLNEEDLSTPFDISSISSHVDVQIVCDDVMRAYEQYTKKLDCPCFNEVREFAKVHSRDSHKYSRSGVTRDWGYDLVIIDFPTHDLQSNDYLEVPEWNKCTHSLVQAAFSFGTLCLDDDGWIVSICSPEQWKTIEKEARLKCLETTRFYFLQQDGAFGYTKDRMGMFANNVLIVNLWSRKGTKPSLQTSGISKSDSFSCAKASLKHFFTPGSRLAASQSAPGRKLIEKSIDFMKFIIENMSPKEGLILDIFSGTGSTLVASAILSRHCYGIDNDKALVEHVRFTRLSKLQKVPHTTTEKHNISFEEESEDEIPQEDDEPA